MRAERAVNPNRQLAVVGNVEPLFASKLSVWVDALLRSIARLLPVLLTMMWRYNELTESGTKTTLRDTHSTG